ncbi:MAG: hypothetical protein ACTSR5_08225 [Promethearchaeota archaeon]
MHGYGGYYIIPDDPVDINIVKEFIESYTAWTAIVSDNMVTISRGSRIYNWNYFLQKIQMI